MISLTGSIASGEKVLAAAREWHQAHASRAGRQGAGHRVRRRGSRVGGRRRAHLRLLQRRAGLHRRLPHLRRPEDLRQAGRGSLERRQQHQGGHAGRRGRRDGAAHHARSSARASRVSCSARRRSATSKSPPAARREPAADSSTSPRSSPARSRRDEIVQKEVFGPVCQRHALQGCRPGHRVGQRLRLRPGVIRVDARTSARR